MAKRSAGILLFRRTPPSDEPEVFLVHPGGPFWARRDDGVWSIPKGEVDPDEEVLAAARRELKEETGCAPDGAFLPLTAVKQRSGKWVHAWALEADCDPAQLVSSRFSLEWPPRSGRHQEFPEVDRAAWFSVEDALRKILPGQRGLILELVELLKQGER